MKNMKIYTQKNIRDRISLILEGEEENFYRISPEDYLLLLKMSGYNPAVTKIKKFKGKPLYIDGDLDISGIPISTLGNVIYVNGYLNAGNTQFLELPSDIVKGHISYHGTPHARKKFQDELNTKRAENGVKRENNEWGDNDEESLMAQALYEYLKDNDNVDYLSDDEKEELETLKERLSRIETEYDETQDDEEISKLSDMIDEITEKIEELEVRNLDIYDSINILNYGYYGEGRVFELLSDMSYNRGTIEYAVINVNDEDKAIREYAESFLDSAGFEGINEYTVESCIDSDTVVEMAREDYEEQVRENLDSYFDDEDYSLSSEMMERVANLESYVSELEDYISELEDKQSELESEIEDPDEYSTEYDNIQSMIDESEEKKSNAESEIEEINDNKEVSEFVIEDKIDSLVNEVERNPLDYLKEIGYTGRNLENFVDNNCILEQLVQNFDMGDINSYDGSYDEVSVGGESFYILRVN